MNRIIDFFINLTKWPVAIFLLLSIPALLESFEHFNYASTKVYAFGGGVLLYASAILFAGYNTCRNLQVISHELTHTVFALLTLHSAGRIRVNPDGSGGSMQLKGGGNWLITLAPYFFPLFAFLYMLIMPYLLRASDSSWIIYTVYGFLIAYYWATVLDQVHPKQTDIIREGYIFSTIIIIGANLYISGIALAFNSQQWVGVSKYMRLIAKLNRQYWPQIIDYIKLNF